MQELWRLISTISSKNCTQDIQEKFTVLKKGINYTISVLFFLS